MPYADPSVLADAPIPVILEAVSENLRDDVPAERLAGFGSMVLHRTLWLLRQAARDAIVEERHALATFMASPSGEAVRRRDPELFSEWKALSGLLGEAAHRSDKAAADSILLSDSGRGRTVVELVAERDHPVPRRVIREHLGISESHLSHLLKDLEEAHLIDRISIGREVHIALGPVGREVVERAVLPAWLVYVLERMPLPDSGVHTIEACETELLRRGAPSKTAAHKFAQALAGVDWLERKAATRRGEGRTATFEPTGGSTFNTEREQDSVGAMVWRQ